MTKNSFVAEVTFKECKVDVKRKIILGCKIVFLAEVTFN